MNSLKRLDLKDSTVGLNAYVEEPGNEVLRKTSMSKYVEGSFVYLPSVNVCTMDKPFNYNPMINKDDWEEAEKIELEERGIIKDKRPYYKKELTLLSDYPLLTDSFKEAKIAKTLSFSPYINELSVELKRLQCIMRWLFFRNGLGAMYANDKREKIKIYRDKLKEFLEKEKRESNKVFALYKRIVRCKNKEICSKTLKKCSDEYLYWVNRKLDIKEVRKKLNGKG